MIEEDDYFNQIAEKKGGETSEFYNGPALTTMLEDLVPADYGATYFGDGMGTVLITVTGAAPGSGTITVTGAELYGDDPNSEVVVINGNGEYFAYDKFTEIYEITSVGLADEGTPPNIVIQLYDQSGAMISTFGWDPIKCRWEENPIIKPSGGGWDYGDGKVFTKEAIEIDDVLKYGGIEFTVLDVRIHRDLDGEEIYRTVVY